MSAVLRTSEHDDDAERVARILEDTWGLTLTPTTGDYPHLNYSVARDGVTVGWVKIKCRDKSVETFDTTWLGVLKYAAMLTHYAQTRLPVLFVVAFTDDIRWIKIEKVDPRDPELKGRLPRAGAPNDRELMIDIPISTMRPVVAADRMQEGPQHEVIAVTVTVTV